ncbi:penicillin-binding transpeptidase domain-containing protein [Haloechinothrix halophila]|uniref:penicillin-binding transpeptidase domain-containing protein n=1 Tax=Haloechinothrix halophila TaxID=1069073 RepID=UPI0004262737|nr:penicillin-binding transpeptidase domain-containing protein [Haloechinothrix halophila]
MRTSLSLLLVIVLAVSGCSLFDSEGPDDTVQAFVGALSNGDITGAAALTDSPESARDTVDQAIDALEPESLTGEIRSVAEAADSASARATLAFTWQLPDDRTWSYETEFELLPSQEGWQVRWTPTVLHPELAAQQTVALVEEAPELAPVLDRDGQALLRPQSVVSIVLYPAEARADAGLSEIAGELADSLARFDDSITTRSIMRQARDVDGKDESVLVAVLRENDYQRVKPDIYELPGVKFSRQERLLAKDKDFGLHVLSAIRRVVRERIEGTVGWRIIARDASGAETAELHVEEPAPSEAVETTLSERTQTAAENAIDDTPKPAAVVAMRASTGDLLAVAQNEKANEQGPIALTGRYPPGSTFKIATALAALTADDVRPRSMVDCPGTITVNGREIPNQDEFDLGKVRLSTAFARSCNTTFASLATDLPPDALTDAARDLGIGADFVIPAITTITGSAPPAENRVQRAENGFGQGTVLASPFGMTLAAATVKAGETPVPTLLVGEGTEAKRIGEPLPDTEASALRRMMRAVVTRGSATRLSGLSGVHGKTGTAQYGDGSKSHGWFVGYSGDTAFAVLIVGGGSSRPAVDVARRMLTELG